MSTVHLFQSFLYNEPTHLTDSEGLSMKRWFAIALLASGVLTGCGSSYSSQSYAPRPTPHCFEFRQRHLLVLHRYLRLRFYYQADFAHYVAAHPGIHYRRISCYGHYAYGNAGYGSGHTSKIAIAKRIYQAYKRHRASSPGGGFHFHLGRHH